MKIAKGLYKHTPVGIFCEWNHHGSPKIQDKGGPCMSDGGSRLREQQTDTESVEPPLLNRSRF
jgi:hypothetical protein